MIRNKPDLFGYKVGEQLAKFADHAEEEFSEAMGFIPLRCVSCAYRKGTYPNGCLATVANALKTTMENGEPFLCHHEIDGDNPICAGWMLLNTGNSIVMPFDYIEGSDKPYSLNKRKTTPCAI